MWHPLSKPAWLTEMILSIWTMLQRKDLHASRLRAGKSHAGIILARQQAYPIGEMMRRLLRLVSSRSAEDMKDRVEFLSSWG